MKKILLFLAVMAHGLYLSGQNTIFPKVGATVSTIEITFDHDTRKPKSGFNVGVGLNFPITDMFSLQPELQFIQKGLESEFYYYFSGPIIDGFEMGDFTVPGIKKWTLNYLELPILAKVTAGKGSFKYFLNAGPSLGIGLGGKSEITINGTKTSGKIKFGKRPDHYTEDEYIDNRLDLGLQFGGGFLIANKVMIDIRYGLGLSNLLDEWSGLTDEVVKSKNRVLQFTVGIPFKMNNKDQ